MRLDPEWFPVLITNLRHRLGISAREAARRAGLSPSYVSKLENGAFYPTLDRFATLMRVLGANDDEILLLVHSLENQESGA
jgi:transcriptional regulator with XRE-family HTH domain